MWATTSRALCVVCVCVDDVATCAEEALSSSLGSLADRASAFFGDLVACLLGRLRAGESRSDATSPLRERGM